ncbi:MAG: histidine phosphatase family protein [Pirellulales bacterium]|nr:histidine phosphatase family protein [Pirellulales bacterium]
MARLLYIVRHAWAGEYGDPRWPDDRLRPLTDEGRERFACVAKKLVKKHGFAPELIATSPLVRCRQTADLLLERLKQPLPLVELAALEPGSDLDALVAWTNAQEQTAVAWVGHAPDVLELTAALTGAAELEKFPKGATAAIEFDDAVTLGEGRLLWLLTAKKLGC